jgi:hypothetical protein
MSVGQRINGRLDISEGLLAGLHKVHPAYRMMNGGQSFFNRVPTVCNQLLLHL